ncbi:hypothetical protein BOX15_Mlig029267g2 [Macrostomum lignano]|uniref:Uncharacterized protein n=2 Tax=Macrostomum lignano TaxID=282301 RepID=A0A267FI72_9PLAT|nr:hypothetical protein BOX15_Mlig029267g2 [Macrostomum lignano]
MAATWSVTDYQYNVTTRPYIESCELIWPRNDKRDAVHTASPFSSNRNPRDFYVIHPDWTSEALSAAPLAPPNTAKEDGRRRPWLWEHPRARELFYPDKRTQLRNRVLRDMQTEDRVRRLHTDPHYQVKHNSPWYVNNPAEVRDSNPLEKRRPLPDLYHQRPWNNARQVLARELANPVPPEARLLAANSSEMNGRTMTESEVARFRCNSRQYMTPCDWN